jgi:4-amino-4-deoxy-L-arabinose transferase-like glycosyltransferase
MQSSTPANKADRRWYVMPAQRWDSVAVFAIVFGAVMRVGWIMIVHPPPEYVYSDMRGYVIRAERLASGNMLGPVDAFYPPGTQWLLAIPLKVFGTDVGLWVAAGLWCVLSIAVVWLSWRLARELLTPVAAGLTAVLCALSPLFITYGGFFTSETPALAFLLAALWLGVMATRRAGRTAVLLSLSSGLLGGVAMAVRPQFLLNLLIMAAVIVFAFRKGLAPLASFGAGVVAVLAVVVTHNTAAAGHLTGLATNSGLNFWFGHCEAKRVTTFDDKGRQTAQFAHTVPNLTGRGGEYTFHNVDTWDDQFFYQLGWECIQQDGPAHVFRLARNIIDMTATTVPFPQADSSAWQRDVVQASNVAYNVLLPWILIESLFLIARRRRTGDAMGEIFLLVNLACAAVLAMLIVGDPRVRSVYDVFGLALLAALIADRFHLDDSDQSQPESEKHPPA